MGSMNVFEAFELLERASTPEPPGCQWLNWDLLGAILVRPIRGFLDDEGEVWIDAATVGLTELSEATGDAERLKLIHDAEDAACRRIVRFSVDEARPLG
jgi:hypothetical protein